MPCMQQFEAAEEAQMLCKLLGTTATPHACATMSSGTAAWPAEPLNNSLHAACASQAYDTTSPAARSACLLPGPVQPRGPTPAAGTCPELHGPVLAVLCSCACHLLLQAHAHSLSAVGRHTKGGAAMRVRKGRSDLSPSFTHTVLIAGCLRRPP